MVKKNSNSKKCTSGGPERPDRALLAGFEPLSLEVRYPDTAIILLKSPEKPILLQAAAALSKFAVTTNDGRAALFDLGIVENVLGLIRHEDLFTRRFALKLLALMSAVENVQAHLLKDETYIVYFTETLINESDVFLQEFSSRILAELTSDPLGSMRYLEKFKDLSFLFGKLGHNDPDIKKNCIEIINHLLKDLDGLSIVKDSKDFSFKAIYELFMQPYPIIQELALDVIKLFVMYNRDDQVQETFRQSGGVLNLLNILNHDEWSDLHKKVLETLNLACDNKKTIDSMNSTDSTKRLFTFMEKTSNEKLRTGALKILVRLAETMNGKKVLYNSGIVDYLCKYLSTTTVPSTQAIICEGVARMVQYGPATEQISQENFMNYIINLFTNNNAEWTERQAAIFALKELFTSDYQNCVNFLDSNGHVHLMRFIVQPQKNTPWESQVTIVEALSAIANYSSLAQDLIDFELFSALCSTFEPDSEAADELKIACCHCLARFIVNQDARKVLIRVRLPRKLLNLTNDTQLLPVRSAAAQLLLQLSCDPIMANLCSQEGHLFYMLKNPSMSQLIPAWAGCIDALFNADLAMKFAYTGRLSLRDITPDGFYVMRRCSCPFPVLEELFRLKLCPLEPIYVVNFSETQNDQNDDYLTSKQAAFDAAKASMKRESTTRGIRVSDGTINAWLELKFGRLQEDCDLQRYLQMFRIELAGDECVEPAKENIPDLIQVSKIASRAQLLAKFVARQLSGATPTDRCCIEQQLELHLRTIKNKLETSVIPLGMLRIGSYLERAILFKVMADKIALPAALIRGRYGHSWIEISVPVTEPTIKCEESAGSCSIDIRECMRDSRITGLPSKYLRENFIVDLMNSPGELIPIGSARGKNYRDRQPRCQRPCCE